jgi:glycosyltransferase involved in cell wall biosynthesis
MERAKRAGVGVVLWGHGYSKNETWARRRYRNLLAGYADAVITYNRRSARELKEEGITSHKIFVAPNTLDDEPIASAMKHWADGSSSISQFQESLGVNGRPVMLYVSRLVDSAEWRALLEVWSVVVGMMPCGRLIIVGEGPGRFALERAIVEGGMEETVKCVGAVFREEALAPYFLSARGLLYPRRLGLSLNHAMTYGVPVVTFDDAAHHGPEFEALRHGFNGLVAAVGDVTGLALQALRILSDDDLARRLGRGARETMRNGYRLDSMVAGFLGAVHKAGMEAFRRRNVATAYGASQGDS